MLSCLREGSDFPTCCLLSFCWLLTNVPHFFNDFPPLLSDTDFSALSLFLQSNIFLYSHTTGESLNNINQGGKSRWQKAFSQSHRLTLLNLTPKKPNMATNG